MLGVQAVGLATGSLAVNPEPGKNGTKDPHSRNQDGTGGVRMSRSTVVARWWRRRSREVGKSWGPCFRETRLGFVAAPWAFGWFGAVPFASASLSLSL